MDDVSGARFKIHAADLVDDQIVPTVVQPEGKPRDGLRLVAQRCPSWRSFEQFPGDRSRSLEGRL